MTTSHNGVLYDTDFIISLFIKEESTHSRAVEIFDTIDLLPSFTLKLVTYELATVLSRKVPHSVVSEKMQQFHTIPFTFLPLFEKDEKDVWQEFYSYQKKGISLVDCANLVMARKLNLKIASFDKFYPRELMCQ